MKVTVIIPAALRQYTRNASEIEVDVSTVNDTLLRLEELCPGLRSFILDENWGVRRYVNIFVNEKDIRAGDGLMTKLKDGDRVYIIPAIAGGS